eukprot:6204536-Pleurochrysis_carterae.AAC.1
MHDENECVTGNLDLPSRFNRALIKKRKRCAGTRRSSGSWFSKMHDCLTFTSICEYEHPALLRHARLTTYVAEEKAVARAFSTACSAWAWCWAGTS